MSTRSSRGTTILVVDDSESTCESVRGALEHAGFCVRTLTSPFGFIKTVRETRPAVVLLDVGLGTVNGTKLVPLCRQHAAPRTKILLYSGRDEAELAEDVRHCGADGFISKRAPESRLVREVTLWASRVR